jgi:hypothetical protein
LTEIHQIVAVTDAAVRTDAVAGTDVAAIVAAAGADGFSDNKHTMTALHTKQ